jgi:hypothetical protein
LLPTPPRDDAVTFDYWATTHPGADFHRASKASSRTHDSRFRGNDTTLKDLILNDARDQSPVNHVSPDGAAAGEFDGHLLFDNLNSC